MAIGSACNDVAFAQRQNLQQHKREIKEKKRLSDGFRVSGLSLRVSVYICNEGSPTDFGFRVSGLGFGFSVYTCIGEPHRFRV